MGVVVIDEADGLNDGIATVLSFAFCEMNVCV